jgi:hypothetical protein
METAGAPQHAREHPELLAGEAAQHRALEDAGEHAARGDAHARPGCLTARTGPAGESQPGQRGDVGAPSVSILAAVHFD